VKEGGGMKQDCVHSCKGLCNALEVAELREAQAAREYREYAAVCDYPDVRELLETLALEREKMLTLLREKREILAVKFSTLDKINESFS
jgi:rubrerythrin